MIDVQMYPERVLTPLSEATEANLMKFGAYVRRRARQSLKYGGAVSKPGQPPKARRVNRRNYKQPHSPLREFILFDVDKENMQVVIGPKMLSGRTNAAGKLEKGGTVRTHDGKMVTIQPRPFMAPAFEAELMQAPALWAGAIN